MQKLILTLWGLSFSLVLQAQVSAINWNAALDKKELKKARRSFLGSTEEYYYIFDKPKSENAILQYDLSHQLINTFPVNTQKGEKKEFRKIINTSSGGHIIATDSRKKQLSFYTSSIQSDGGTEMENRLSFTSDTRNITPFHTDISSGNYHDFTSRSLQQDAVGFFFSQNKTKVVYANTQNNQDADMELGTEKYHLVVLDENFEKLWEREIDFQTKTRKIKIRQVAVSNSGEIYLLAIAAKENQKLNFGLLLGTDITPRYDVVVYKINKTNQLEPQIIKIDGVHPTHSKLFLNEEDGGFWLTGFFTQENTKRFLREHGVYLTKYDSNGKQLMKTTHQWEDSFYEQLKDQKVKKAKNPWMTTNSYTFRIGNIFINPSSHSLSFVADYIYSKNLSNSTDTRSMHLIIPYFSLDGEYLRTVCIEKKDIRSYRGQPAMMDYFSMQKDGMLYFIFNDDKTSKELREMPKFKGKQMANFIELAQVNPNGEIVFREIIYNTSETNSKFQPYNTRYMGDGLILIDSGGWRQSRVGFFKLP